MRVWGSALTVTSGLIHYIFQSIAPFNSTVLHSINVTSTLRIFLLSLQTTPNEGNTKCRLTRRNWRNGWHLCNTVSLRNTALNSKLKPIWNKYLSLCHVGELLFNLCPVNTSCYLTWIWQHNSVFAAIFASELSTSHLMRIVSCEFVTPTFVSHSHSQEVWTRSMNRKYVGSIFKRVYQPFETFLQNHSGWNWMVWPPK